MVTRTCSRPASDKTRYMSIARVIESREYIPYCDSSSRILDRAVLWATDYLEKLNLRMPAVHTSENNVNFTGSGHRR